MGHVAPETDSKITLNAMLAMLAAVAMFFSTLEYLIPKPVPFLRIGLANLPILIVLPFFRVRHVVVLALLKVLGQGLINGTLASYVFLFSLAGTVSSVALMILLHRLGGRRIGLAGVSAAGALASNLVQITLSVVFIFGSRSWVIAPPFLIIGTISGVFLGVVAEVFTRRSQWVRRVAEDYQRIVAT